MPNTPVASASDSLTLGIHTIGTQSLRVGVRAPRNGQHSEEVLREYGFSPSEIGDLISMGIVKGSRLQDDAVAKPAR